MSTSIHHTWRKPESVMDIRVCSSSCRLSSRPSPRPCLTGRKTGNCASGQVDPGASQIASRSTNTHAVKHEFTSRLISKVEATVARTVADTRSSQGQYAREGNSEGAKDRSNFNFAQRVINAAKGQRPQQKVRLSIANHCVISFRLSMRMTLNRLNDSTKLSI